MKKIGTTEMKRVERSPYASNGKGRITASSYPMKQQKPVISPKYIAIFLWMLVSVA
jgi:hypothetical protein